MGDFIHLSEREHWALNMADELEHAGHQSAADWLRRRVQSLAPFWRREEEMHKLKSIGGDAMLRLHHGSNPPLTDDKPPTRPIFIPPSAAPRPDQIVS